MARDHGRIRLDIWSDDDWRRLPSVAQWLYFLLLSSPSLNYCGVADWRPNRIAPLAADLTAHDVEFIASYLEQGRFVIIDRDTEEVLVRSFVKHDGLIATPNLTKAMLKAHASVGSSRLRAVVVHELIRLRSKNPSFAGWEHVGRLLEKESITPDDAIAQLPRNPSVTPSGMPSDTGSVDPSGTGQPMASVNASKSDAPLLTPYSLLLGPSSKSDHLPGVRHQGAGSGALNLDDLDA